MYLNKEIYKLLLTNTFAIFLVIGQGMIASSAHNKIQSLPLKAKWCLQNLECISLEVANTKEKQLIGLMNREHLHRGEGMLFLLKPRRKVKIWMYKTLISLDVIFYSNGSVIRIDSQLKTCKSLPCKQYGPNYPVDGIVEIASGEAKRLNIKLGDPVDIQFD